MSLIIIHLVATFSTLFLVTITLFFSKKSLHTQKNLIYVLCSTFMVSAITGIFLNLKYFTGFHVLSIITILTIPLGLYQWSKGNISGLYHSVFNNYLGLIAALIGALYPGRFVGFRFWTPLQKQFNLPDTTIDLLHISLFIITLVAIAYFAIQSYRNPKFFKYTNN